MEAIIDQHMAKGRPYPRPIRICKDCDGNVILCWGQKTKPYFRHLSKDNVVNTCSGESLMHSLAKELLQRYLLNRGKMIVKCKCISCHRMKETNYFKGPNSEVVLEYRYNNIVLDLACVSDSTIVFGVEIYNTHKTNTVRERSEITWFELQAEQIIDMLDVAEPSKILYLDDLRNDIGTKCGQCQYIKQYTTEKLITELRYKVTSSSYVAESRKLVNHRQSVKQYTMEELATELGYKIISSPYPTESRKLVDHCWGYYINKEKWRLRRKSDDVLWSQFLAKQQCMKCLKGWNTGKFRPFCRQCYSNITDEPCDEVKVEVTDEEKYRCRALFRWLNNVPGDWDHGLECYGCKRNYVSEDENNRFSKYWADNGDYVKCYTWWFGQKKRCCTVCLQERYENTPK